MRQMTGQSSKLEADHIAYGDSILRAALTLTIWLSLSLFATAAEYRWSGVDRVVAMSDPHGDFDAMVRTLSNAGVTDVDGNWTGGETHLVITGDLLDRGADSRKIMDLVMQLEVQAPESGGKVILTLGNHEVMNLVGDLRYVAPGEYAAFADEESDDERERWFRILLATRQVQTDGGVDEMALRAEFDRDRPPGFYAHRQAFSSDGKYGQWLMQKPMMVVVNDTAYTHGGMPPMVAELGLDKLNEQLRAEVNDYVFAMEKLFELGLIDPATNFYEQGRIAEGIATDASIPPETLSALDTVVSLNDARVHSQTSPLWYRGTVGCSVLSEGDVIAGALAAVGASRVVIGHTPTVTRQVLERFDGRVIEIDTGMLNAAYKGSGFALILEDDHVAVAQERTDELTTPVKHPRRVGERADSLTAEALTELLTSGEITSTTTDEAGRTVVEVNRNGSTVTALFAPSPRKKGLEPELAAYKLDLMMDLDIVPVTVSREVDGNRGTLQFLPKNARDETYRAGSGQGGGAWCPLRSQWSSLYIFDVLVNNEGRLPNSMVYSTGNWQLMSMGHAGAFGTGKGRPKYLAEAELKLTTTWAATLTGLSNEVLTQQLGEVLSRRQISAIGKRRDALLEEAR